MTEQAPTHKNSNVVKHFAAWRPALVNLAIFQVCWLACVLTGAASLPLIGIAVVAAAVAYHLRQAARPWSEAALLTVAGLIGAAWDGQLAGYGWLVYPSGEFASWIAPSWIIAMWIAFATTLNVSLQWLRGRPGLALVFGAIGGPLAFYAGERLGAVEFTDPLIALSAQSAGWALITPVLVSIATRLDGYAAAETDATGSERAHSRLDARTGEVTRHV